MKGLMNLNYDLQRPVFKEEEEEDDSESDQ